MTNKTYNDIIFCWKQGYKINKIAKHLGISENHAQMLFTQILNIELGLQVYDIFSKSK